jgi:cell division septum initiation protein DivIVA
MEDLLKFYQLQNEALKKRNEYLENELKQAKEILQSLINDLEVIDATNANDEPICTP